jgi:hypothetical protein
VTGHVRAADEAGRLAADRLRADSAG